MTKLGAALCTTFALSICFESDLIGPASSGSVFAANSPGHVAVRDSDDGQWRMLANGDRLPSGLLRTSAAGPARLTVPRRGQLILAPNSEVRCDLKHQLIVVRRGTALLDLQEFADEAVSGNKWTLTSGRVHDVTLRAVWPFAMQYSSSRTAAIYAGGVNVDGRDKSGAVKKLSLEEPQLLAWTESNVVSVVTPKTDDWQKKAKRWADGGPSVGLGQLLVKDAQSRETTRMEIARYHVNVVLKPPVALVQIDESFYNPASGQREGTFVFNLPRGASISRFAMFVTHEQLIEGEVIERKRASNIYESIVRSMRDPAILEQIGDNQFRMRVFPIPAKDTKRILLDFTVPLTPIDGRYEFHLPLMGDSLPVWDFNLTGTASNIDTSSFQSPTYPDLKLEQGQGRGNSLKFSTSGRMLKLERDLALNFRQPKRPKFNIRSYVAKEDDKPVRYFMAEIPARDISPADQKPLPPADVILAADTSGTSPLPDVRRALSTVLHNLRPDDRFQLGCVDAGYRPLTGNWLTASSDQAATALAKFDRQIALGGTDLDDSIRQAINHFDEQSRRPRVLIYVGDGKTTVNKLDESVAGRLGDEDVYFVGVWTGAENDGYSDLKSITENCASRLFDLSTGPDRLGELFSWMLKGMPKPRQFDIDINGIPASDVFVTEPLSDDGTVQVFAKAKESQRLRLVAGEKGEAPAIDMPLQFSNREKDVFVGRLWAQRKLMALSSDVGDSDKAKKAIINLSQTWSLLSPYTAFLVLEKEADYARYNINRTQRHKYWSPPEALPQITPPIGRIVRRKPDVDKAIEFTNEWKVEDAHKRLQRHLGEGNGSQALTALQDLQRLHSERDPFTDPAQDLKRPDPARDLTKLQQQVLAALRTETFLTTHPKYAPLFDRSQSPFVETPRATSAMQARFESSPQFRDWHPHGEQLAQNISVGSFELSIADFAKWLRLKSRTPVVIDRQALLDDGIDPREALVMPSMRDVSLRTAARRFLNPQGCTLVDGEHVIQITSQLAAEETLDTRVYPVVDLVRTDRLPDKGWMANPFLDREELAEQRIQRKLNQKIKADFVEVPLSDAVAYMSKELGESIVIEEQALLDDGIGTDEPITLQLPKVPAREVFRWAFETLGLTAIQQDDVLLLTTQLHAEELLSPRVYSAVGLVHKLPPQAAVARQRMWGFKGFGGGFGFGGGGLGGGGFGGGGFGGGGAGGAFGGGGGGGFGFGGGGLGGGGFAGGFGGFGGFGGGAVGNGGFFGGNAGLGGFGFNPGPVGPFANPQQPEFEPEPEPFWDDTELRDALMDGTIGQWEDTDGTGGTVSFLPSTMTWVIRQTEESHTDTGKLFSRLRQLKVDDAAKPRDLPNITAKHASGWDFSALIEVLQYNTPTQWLDVDGSGGTISENQATMSLVIRQTTEGHEALYDLLAKLRRAAHATRTGKIDTFLPNGRLRPWAIARSSLTNWATDADAADELKATDAELKLLAVRRPASSGVWNAERLTGPIRTARVGFTRDGARSRLRLPIRDVRIDGGLAAVSYPGLHVVEVGAWTESARSSLDAELPWLPHRSNADLARMFDVTRVGEDGDAVRLRLTVPGVKESTIVATISKETGRVTQWSAQLGDKPISRIQIANDGSAATSMNAAGTEIESWRMVDRPDEAVRVPSLWDGWDGQLVIVSESAVAAGTKRPESAAVKAYRDGMERLSRGDRQGAVSVLRRGLESAPKQPMLLFLLASCFKADDKLSPISTQEATEALRDIARAGASGFFDDFDADTLAFLTPALRHELLKLQPADSLNADDWDRLAIASLDVGRFQDALDQVAKSRELAGTRSNFNRRFCELGALIGLKQTDAAKKLAEQLARQDLAPEQAAQLAKRVASGGFVDLADNVLASVITDELSGTERERMVHHRASLHAGLRRWRIMLNEVGRQPIEAAADIGLSQQAETDEFWLTMVSSELNNMESAAKLAKEFAGKPVEMPLLIREVDLTENSPDAADKAWKLWESKRLPHARLEWLTRFQVRAGKYDCVVAVVESEARRSPVISEQLLEWLRQSYAQLGREAEALRASTHSNEVTSK